MDNSPVSVVSDGELEESGQLIIPLRNLISLAVNIALLIIVLLPLIGTSFNFGPAWPGGLLTIPVLTSFANLLVLIYVFRFWSNLRPRGLKLRMTIFLIVLVLSLLGYWAIFNTYTYPIIGTGGRIVGGFTLTPIATEFMNRGGPVPIHDLLLNFGLDPALVWTRSSIAAVNASLSALWVLTFLGLTVIIGALTLSLPRRAAGSIFFVKSQSTKEAQLERVIERVEKEPEKAKPAWDLASGTFLKFSTLLFEW